MSKIKLPKGERAWCSYYSYDKQPVFVITSKKESRETYFIYEYKNGELKKLGRSKSPGELEKKYDVKKVIMRGKHE